MSLVLIPAATVSLGWPPPWRGLLGLRFWAVLDILTFYFKVLAHCEPRSREGCPLGDQVTGIGLPLQGSWVLASVLQMSVSSLLSLSPSLAPPSWPAPCLSLPSWGPVLSPLWPLLSFLVVELAGKLSPCDLVSVSKAGATEPLRLSGLNCVAS